MVVLEVQGTKDLFNRFVMTLLIANLNAYKNVSFFVFSFSLDLVGRVSMSQHQVGLIQMLHVKMNPHKV